MPDGRTPRVLVVGPERSGTSWLGTTLRSTGGAGYLAEPDHAGLDPFAARALRGLGTHPVVTVGEPAPRAYRKLWESAFGTPPRYLPGQRRLSRVIFRHVRRAGRLQACHPHHPHVAPRLLAASLVAVPRHFPPDVSVRVVKSARAHFALEWICATWDPTVIVCRRHPLDIVASALALSIPWKLDWLAPAARAQGAERFGVAEPAADDRVACMAWRTGLLMSVLDEQLGRHPEWHVADHERLCLAPLDRLRELAAAVGLEWTAESDRFVVEHERPGTGFEINRIAAEQPGKWRSRLSADEAWWAAKVLAQFPVGERYDLAV